MTMLEGLGALLGGYHEGTEYRRQVKQQAEDRAQAKAHQAQADADAATARDRATTIFNEQQDAYKQGQKVMRGRKLVLQQDGTYSPVYKDATVSELQNMGYDVIGDVPPPTPIVSSAGETAPPVMTDTQSLPPAPLTDPRTLGPGDIAPSVSPRPMPGTPMPDEPYTLAKAAPGAGLATDPRLRSTTTAPTVRTGSFPDVGPGMVMPSTPPPALPASAPTVAASAPPEAAPTLPDVPSPQEWMQAHPRPNTNYLPPEKAAALNNTYDLELGRVIANYNNVNKGTNLQQARFTLPSGKVVDRTKDYPDGVTPAMWQTMYRGEADKEKTATTNAPVAVHEVRIGKDGMPEDFTPLWQGKPIMKPPKEAKADYDRTRQEVQMQLHQEAVQFNESLAKSKEVLAAKRFFDNERNQGQKMELEARRTDALLAAAGRADLRLGLTTRSKEYTADRSPLVLRLHDDQRQLTALQSDISKNGANNQKKNEAKTLRGMISDDLAQIAAIDKQFSTEMKTMQEGLKATGGQSSDQPTAAQITAWRKQYGDEKTRGFLKQKGFSVTF